MTEELVAVQQEDPWKMVCPLCSGVLWEYPCGVTNKAHHYFCDNCGKSFRWCEL